MDLGSLTALGTLIFAVVNFLKYLSGKNWNGAVTQAIAWIAGVVGVIIFAHTTFSAAMTIGGISVAKMGFWSQLYLGLMATSILTTVNEGYKSIDRTQTQDKPKLLPRLYRHAIPVNSTEVVVPVSGGSQPPPHHTAPSG